MCLHAMQDEEECWTASHDDSVNKSSNILFNRIDNDDINSDNKHNDSVVMRACLEAYPKPTMNWLVHSSPKKW